MLRWPEDIRGCPTASVQIAVRFKSAPSTLTDFPRFQRQNSRGIADFIKVSLVAPQAHVIAAEQT